MVRKDIEINDFISELGSLTTANLMEKVRGLQNLAYQLGLDECEYPDYINSGLPVVYFTMSSSCNTDVCITFYEGKILL